MSRKVNRKNLLTFETMGGIFASLDIIKFKNKWWNKTKNITHKIRKKLFWEEVNRQCLLAFRYESVVK